jgi:predicted dinucleotide-binding enzyme
MGTTHQIRRGVGEVTLEPQGNAPGQTIGILGAGAIGRALARHFVNAGCGVILSNSRGPESLADVVAELGGAEKGVRAGTVAEAASAEIVVVSLLWQHLEPVLSGLPPWNGRIVIDAANPIINPGFHIADLGGRTSSEVVAALVPGAHLIKAGNTFAAATLALSPSLHGGRRALFLCGDDKPSKHAFGAIMDRAGFAVIDLGTLSEGARLMQFPSGKLPGLDLVKF